MNKENRRISLIKLMNKMNMINCKNKSFSVDENKIRRIRLIELMKKNNKQP